MPNTSSQFALFFIIVVVTCVTTVSSSFCDTSPSWALSWEDDFNEPTLDLTSWTIQVGNAGRNIGSCRDALCTAENVYVENGNLVIVSKREEKGGYNFTTGGLDTSGKKNWAYDPTYRLCVTAKLPGGNGGGQGVWPAHWLMPDDASCDPDEGEIDILEMVDGDEAAHATYHWQTTWPQTNCSYPKGHKQASIAFDIPTFASEYHEYAVEHSPDFVAFVYDGVTVLNTTKEEGTLFWGMPFYLIVNTAIGGSWPGMPNSTTLFPAFHYIDKVKVVTATS